MPDLVLAEAPSARSGEPDPIWPWTGSHASAWAIGLHDELERGQRDSDLDRPQQIASWLRVQAVGRDTVCVVEPRIATYRSHWNAAAAIAGLSPVRLRHADGSAELLPPAEPTTATAGGDRSVAVETGLRQRARLWLTDRGEAMARATIRAIQR